MFRRVWVVQDAETGKFLCPTPDGDVGYTRWLHNAGLFDDEEAAVDTASALCTEGFSLFDFYKPMTH